MLNIQHNDVTRQLLHLNNGIIEDYNYAINSKMTKFCSWRPPMMPINSFFNNLKNNEYIKKLETNILLYYEPELSMTPILLLCKSFTLKK